MGALAIRYRVGEGGDAAEELAQEVGVGFGIDVVCPVVRDLEHGLGDQSFTPGVRMVRLEIIVRVRGEAMGEG